MKNKIINVVLYMVSGILLLLGPHTLFQVCDTSEKIMKCWWSTIAVNVIGALLVFSALLLLFLKDRASISVVNFYNAAAGMAAILIPSVLIGGCANQMMLCRALTFPVIYYVSTAVILFSIGNLSYLKKVQKGT